MKNNQFGLPDLAVQQIRSVFSNYPQINSVVIYGSRAMGNYKTGSDIDLCIVSESLGLTEQLAIENQLDDLLLPWKIDLSLKHLIDNPGLIAHILEKGIVFYP